MNEWVDKSEYPFRSNYMDIPAGRMHYIDEGEGDPIVMVYGNPTWSFLYRYLINGLSKNHRCISLDHIGFGLSDKPSDLRSAEIYRSLQKKGITIRKPIDCMIASVAIEYDALLLHNDRDFDYIVEHSTLRIFD